MLSLALRLAVALLAFLFGLGAAQLRLLSRSQPRDHTIGIAPRPDHPFAEVNPRSAADKGFDPGQPDSIAQTVAYLHRIKAADDRDIPLAARPLLTDLKHQMRDLIVETISALGTESPSAESLRRTLWEQLTIHGVAIEQPKEGTGAEDFTESGYALGDVFDIQVQRPAGHPDLIVVTTTLEIPCGRDTSLYVVQKRDQLWTLVLAQEANEYENVSGAQGRFRYAISPADAKNDFFIVTANVNPWCTSNWQALRYSVVRIGATAYQPWVLAAGEETIYLGATPPYRLEVGKKWFSITFEGNSNQADIANGINSRKHVVKYVIQRERARTSS